MLQPTQLPLPPSRRVRTACSARGWDPLDRRCACTYVHALTKRRLRATQASAFALRLSCATPVLAPGVGFLGVTLASCASGQASATWGAYRRDGGAALDVRTWAARAQVDDLVIDALMGATLFMAMGGRFRSILPSDVRHVVRMLSTLSVLNKWHHPSHACGDGTPSRAH